MDEARAFLRLIGPHDVTVIKVDDERTNKKDDDIICIIENQTTTEPKPQTTDGQEIDVEDQIQWKENETISDEDVIIVEEKKIEYFDKSETEGENEFHIEYSQFLNKFYTLNKVNNKKKSKQTETKRKKLDYKVGQTSIPKEAVTKPTKCSSTSIELATASLLGTKPQSTTKPTFTKPHFGIATNALNTQNASTQQFVRYLPSQNASTAPIVIAPPNVSL
ncbi:jg19067 [Pararge aegeria aegeria]|uniref:Jg19067 protein n=1 Tax=Pararge aegeria aegeria TaxID=348720 RepID=A0A8S4SNP9_9NEOP|nr:jg19067 [Pararge aegeria aegeria]